MEAKLSNKPLFIPPNSLEDATWAQIKEISDAGLASSVFKVGDMKKIVLNGTVGTVQFNNYETYVYIIGIDHNKEIEGTGITFGCFKDKDGKDIALIDNNYNIYSTNGTKYFNMNHWGNYNYGGWAGCDLRYDILGSTDTAPSGYGSAATISRVGYNASATCATNPVTNTLMAALPSDLRSVMKPMTIYTNNTGGSGGDDASYITKTTDHLPLLAEYEIFGTRKYANSFEQNYQAQYAYYSAGNSKVKYRHSATSSTAWWWERSPDYNGNIVFCHVYENGNATYTYTWFSLGLAPIFRV